MFDYRQYWIGRYKGSIGSLRGPGHRRLREDANVIMYLKVQDQLGKLFKELKICLEDKTVLDAGAGTGLFTKWYLDHGAHVTAVDISEDALRVIRKNCPGASVGCCDLKDLDRLDRQMFDIVHCFDVLYHITDDGAWRRAIANLGQAAKQYVILHDRPVRWRPVLECDHVKVRRASDTTAEFSRHGFVERVRYPTHILYVRLPFLVVANIIPRLLYKIDRFLVSKGNMQGFASSHLHFELAQH